jgi:hypothetical protein
MTDLELVENLLLLHSTSGSLEKTHVWIPKLYLCEVGVFHSLLGPTSRNDIVGSQYYTCCTVKVPENVLWLSLWSAMYTKLWIAAAVILCDWNN